MSLSGQSGIDAPSQVEAGSTAPIEVAAPGAAYVSVAVSATGEEFDVKVEDGVARFELPPGATVGTTLLVVDRDDLDQSATIQITNPST